MGSSSVKGPYYFGYGEGSDEENSIASTVYKDLEKKGYSFKGFNRDGDKPKFQGQGLHRAVQEYNAGKEDIFISELYFNAFLEFLNISKPDELTKNYVTQNDSGQLKSTDSMRGPRNMKPSKNKLVLKPALRNAARRHLKNSSWYFWSRDIYDHLIYRAILHFGNLDSSQVLEINLSNVEDKGYDYHGCLDVFSLDYQKFSIELATNTHSKTLKLRSSFDFNRKKVEVFKGIMEGVDRNNKIYSKSFIAQKISDPTNQDVEPDVFQIDDNQIPETIRKYFKSGLYRYLSVPKAIYSLDSLEMWTSQKLQENEGMFCNQPCLFSLRN